MIKTPSLFTNITAGATSQIGIYAANLASLPYLARILGTEGLGQVVYVQSIMALVILVVDFGFSWSAIKVISIIRHDREKISKYFFSTWTAQWVLTIGSGAILILISQQTSIFQASNRQLFFGYLIVVGYTSFPFWLLHGLEKISISTTIQLISKIITIPLLFILVQTPNDIDIAILFYAFCNLLGGFLFIVHAIKSNIIIWVKPSIKEIVAVYKSGWNTFLAKMNFSLSSLLIPIFLNNISGPSELGLYTLADKVKSVIISITSPISSALFPRMSFLVQTEQNEFFKLAYKAAVWQTILLTPLCCLVWFFASDIATLVGGNQFINATSTIRFLAFLPLVTAASNILGIQIMLPMSMEKILSIINFGGLILVTALVLALTPFLQAKGAAFSLLLTEIFILLIMSYKLNIFKLKNKI
jgi:PST family polysaccharide transporter